MKLKNKIKGIVKVKRAYDKESPVSTPRGHHNWFKLVQ